MILIFNFLSFLFATDFTWQIIAKKILMVQKLCFFVNVKKYVFFSCILILINNMNISKVFIIKTLYIDWYIWCHFVDVF